MRNREFEQIVFNMRMRQKEYYRTRDKFYLVESKKLEKLVDEHLKSNTNLFSESMYAAERKDKVNLINSYFAWLEDAKKYDPKVIDRPLLELIDMFLFEN